MPMVVNNHQRLYFRFEGERGAFLMLHHGLFGSHQDWYRAGYVEELAKEFRLVIPDARGHGRSDRPTDPAAFSPDAFASDMLEIMNSLGIRNLHFLGYGLGALIGLEMLRRFPERVRIAVLGGESPLMLPPVRDHWRALADQLEQGTLAALIASLRAGERLVRFADADPPEEERESALALLRALAGWELHNEERVSVMSPVTLFTGTADPASERVERARAYINRARLVPFQNLNHAALFHERLHISQELVRLLKSGRREDGDGHPRQARGEEGEGRRAEGTPNERRGERRENRYDPHGGDRQEERRGHDRRGSGGRRDLRRPNDRQDAPQRQSQPTQSAGDLEAPAQGAPASTAMAAAEAVPLRVEQESQEAANSAVREEAAGQPAPPQADKEESPAN